MTLQFTKLIRTWQERRGLRIYGGAESARILIRADDVLTIETVDGRDFPYELSVSRLTPKGGEPFFVRGKADELMERVNQVLEPKVPQPLPRPVMSQRRIMFEGDAE